MTDDTADGLHTKRCRECDHIPDEIEDPERSEIVIQRHRARRSATVAALVWSNHVITSLSHRAHELAPGIGDLRKAVEQQYHGAFSGLPTRLQDMKRKAVDAVDHSATDV